MAQARAHIAERLTPKADETALRGVDTPLPRSGRVKQFLLNLTHGRLGIVATNAKGDEKQSAQWPVTAIIVTIALALFTAYREFNRDTSKASTDTAVTITELRGEINLLKRDVAEAQRVNVELSAKVHAADDEAKTALAAAQQARIELARAGIKMPEVESK